MLPLPDSGPDTLSPDQSSCSSETGDVLIRSTRVRHGAGPGPGPGPGPVKISVQQRPQLGHRPDKAPPVRAAALCQPDGRMLKKPAPAKENRQATEESGPDRKFAAGTPGLQPPGQDVLTSRFAAGGRGVVLAALKQHSHSAPCRREVRVQRLDPGPPRTGSQEAACGGAGLTSGFPGEATAALIKAQESVEARVSQLADGVQQLLQVDRERGWSLSQQTLRHLETLHGRQLQLQSQLLESALRMVTGHAPVRRDRPAAGQTARLDSAAPVVSSQQCRSSDSHTLSMATPRQDPVAEHSRDDPAVSMTTQPDTGGHLQLSATHCQAAAKRANDMLREAGLLTQPEDSETRPGALAHQAPQAHPQIVQPHQNPPTPNHLRSKSQQTQTHRTQATQVQRRPRVPSTLEDASHVLRQVQRQKKVLEENLEALLRATSGEVLHCQLEALTDNRDSTEEVRIRRTVDAWIDTLSRDIQAEMSTEDAVTKHSVKRDTEASSARTGRGKPMSMLRGTGSKTAAGRRGRGRIAGSTRLQGAEPDREQVGVDGESYLTRLYGRAPYEGWRRTLKKSPYLRLSSPDSPFRRKPRPQVVERVRGVKVKSCKTQTCLAPPLTGLPQHHDIIGSSHLTIPMAIPLGCPRMDSSSRCLAQRQQEATSPPTAPPTSVAMDDEDNELPMQREEQLDGGEAPPPCVNIIDKISDEEEDEEGVFPGTDFLSVADVVQQEELSAVPEEAVRLDGGPSTPLVLYQGPVFPPRPGSALRGQDRAATLGLSRCRDSLENRLVEWVEQQLMSRMISEMYPRPPSDPAQNASTDQSESAQSVTSDIVEAAGGGGLQLFVDSNVSVDSALIRQLVDEVLTEHVALMLGNRDASETRPEPGPEEPKPNSAAREEVLPVVPTPQPTPPASPAPPRSRTPPLTTPTPSETTSLLDGDSPQPVTAPEPVTTPTPSPDPAPPAGSPPAVHLAPPPLIPEDAELPLANDRPEEHIDTQEEEGPRPPPPPGLEGGPASPSSSSEDCGSSGSSSEGTESAVRHISEGELLISVHQRAAMTEVCSVSSSLQDMDFDPHSEGEVIGNNLLLKLLTKMEQGVTNREDRPQPEGSWGSDHQEEEMSLGEVRVNLTTNPSSTAVAGRHGHTSSSPGQISADVSEVSFEAANQLSVTNLTSDLQTDLSPTHATGQVAPYEPQTAGCSRMGVGLPFITAEEEEPGAHTDSSSQDVF